VAKLTPGEAAPAFEAQDQNDKIHSLADYTGQRLFLFFYPKANTSG
jgi:peroxiredoxin Q/BCP